MSIEENFQTKKIAKKKKTKHLPMSGELRQFWISDFPASDEIMGWSFLVANV